MLNFGNKEFRNLQEQVLENAKNIEILKAKPQMRVVVVDELPAVGDPTVIYLVPSDDGEEPNVYEEYVWLEDEERYEMIGTTGIDLSNMVTTDTDQTITGDKTFTGDTTVANLTSEGDIETEGKVIIGATGYDIKKDGSNMVIEADGNPIKVRGDLIPNTGATYTLGNASDNRWKTLYLSHYVDWGSNVYLSKDSSNRLNINTGGDVRIKVGTESSTYCKAHWTPDQSATYNLGTDGLRWNNLYLNDKVYAYESYVTYFNSTSGSIYLKCNFAPNTHNGADLGTNSRMWKDLYIAGNITNGTTSFTVNDVVTKPDYANPDVWASGTLSANDGYDTIDLTIVGMPDDGLYMFTYGNAQCFIAITSTMIQNASLYPMRCACPVLRESGGVITGNTGNLKISRSADILEIKVASTINGSATSTNGWGYQFIKVM